MRLQIVDDCCGCPFHEEIDEADLPRECGHPEGRPFGVAESHAATNQRGLPAFVPDWCPLRTESITVVVTPPEKKD